jgi:hypothetical protein
MFSSTKHSGTHGSDAASLHEGGFAQQIHAALRASAANAAASAAAAAARVAAAAAAAAETSAAIASDSAVAAAAAAASALSMAILYKSGGGGSGAFERGVALVLGVIVVVARWLRTSPVHRMAMPTSHAAHWPNFVGRCRCLSRNGYVKWPTLLVRRRTPI